MPDQATPDAMDVRCDPAKFETFANGHPFDLYAAARAKEPIALFEHEGWRYRYHVLTRYADIDAVSRDTDNFTSTRGFRLPHLEEGRQPPSEIAETISSTFMGSDPPKHGVTRKVLQPHFMPSMLRQIDEEVQGAIDDLIERLRDRQTIEFVSEFAAIVPIFTLMRLLGAPEGDADRIYEWTNRLVGANDPEYNSEPAQAAAAFMEVFNYGTALLEEREASPSGDLLSAVATLPKTDSREEMARRGLFTTLLAAGNETTRNSLTGAIIALTKFPDQKEALIADQSLIPNAVREIVRYVSPVFQMMRFAKRDVEVGGQKITEGEAVVMLYGAANRDPEMFEDPDRLDVRRANANRHLGFGVGVHRCIGAPVATLQLEKMLAALLSNFPAIEAASEPDFLRSNFVSGIKRLNVRLR